MRRQPVFFEAIRGAAQRRWDQLESDPELAGPWHLLFKQVQSPRHVLSELLQNADDADATEASFRIEDGVFIFEHNGHDFIEEEFQSLCRFGFSNKRRLLTIGFRGIGFRSVFSLGESVDVITPTLACRFEKTRFTQPRWIDDAGEAEGTLIRVPLESEEKGEAIRSQIEHWSKSAVPLLFFQSIRSLTLLDRRIQVDALGQGPCKNSQRARVSGRSRESIVFRSTLEQFPADCLAEIRSERGEDIALPPCDVVIVLGAAEDQRLYVVLPTDQAVPLPFSAQAPFVQDPARTGIKDPTSSPTNAWLLERIGVLLAEVLQEWLASSGVELAGRARAYELLPAVPPAGGGGSPLDPATTRILAAFKGRLASAELLLGTDGSLGGLVCTARLPGAVLDAWSPDEARSIFYAQKKRVLAREVSPSARERLTAWGLLEKPDDDTILKTLCDESKARK